MTNTLPREYRTVSDKAVCTVLKCLGLKGYQYDKCRIAYRSFKWVGLEWWMDQYDGLMADIVRPYFKEEFKND